MEKLISRNFQKINKTGNTDFNTNYGLLYFQMLFFHHFPAALTDGLIVIVYMALGPAGGCN